MPENLVMGEALMPSTLGRRLPAAEQEGSLGVSRLARDVEVRRSPKRRRTVSARREGLKTVVFIPARFSAEEEEQWVAEMVQRLDASDRRTGSGARHSDIALMERAHELSLQYLGGKAVPATVRWVSNQHQRWGSCTPGEFSIRLSERLQVMPAFVVDFVLLHELAHLIQPGHGDKFQHLLAGFESSEKAQGYLDGFAAGQLRGRADGAPGPNQGRSTNTSSPSSERALCHRPNPHRSDELGKGAAGSRRSPTSESSTPALW